MTKEELKEEIIKLLLKPISCKMFSDVWLEHKADQILDIKTDFWEGFKQFTLKEFLIRFDGIKEKE